MATLSDYTSGTISLANGSTTVTGTGTLFDVAKFREGDTLQIQNLTAVIARVDSNTRLTLTAPWTGTTLTNAPYRARYLPDGARVTAQTTTLIELLGNGNLQALAGLTGTADTMPYFTGVGTMGRTGLTAFARSLLDDADASTMLGTLGFSNFMRNNVGGLSFAGWGLENANNNVPNDNLDTLRTNGVFRAISSTVGAPTGFLYQILHMGQGANYATQIAFPLSNALSAVPLRRNLVDNIWSDWLPLVAQRGSNTSGEYVRFADGTQICFRTVSSFLVSTGGVYRGLFRAPNADFTFPAGFVGIPAVGCGRGSAFSESLMLEVGTDGSRWLARFASIEAAPNVECGSFSLIAIGRWY